jgi:hypothetical protein
LVRWNHALHWSNMVFAFSSSSNVLNSNTSHSEPSTCNYFSSSNL